MKVGVRAAILRRNCLTGAVALLLIASLAGCRRFGRAAAPSPATEPVTQSPQKALPAPAPSPQVVDQNYENSKAGIKLQYPSNWKPKPSNDDVVLLVPSASDSRTISLDEPSLPAHLPGLIPIGLVQNGYLDDLKKKHPGLKIEEQTEDDPRGNKGRLVHASWAADGKTMDEVTLLAVHGDHVYLLSLDTDRGQYPADRAVFDKIAKSLQWTK